MNATFWILLGCALVSGVAVVADVALGIWSLIQQRRARPATEPGKRAIPEGKRFK